MASRDAEFEFRRNPPQHEQLSWDQPSSASSSSGWGSDAWESPGGFSSPGADPWSSASSADPFGSPGSADPWGQPQSSSPVGWSGSSDPFGQQLPQPGQDSQKNPLEMAAWEAALFRSAKRASSNTGKSLLAFLKSFKSANSIVGAKMGLFLAVAGAAQIALSLVLAVVGLFVRLKPLFPFVLSGLALATLGVFLLMVCRPRARRLLGYEGDDTFLGEHVEPQVEDDPSDFEVVEEPAQDSFSPWDAPEDQVSPAQDEYEPSFVWGQSQEEEGEPQPVSEVEEGSFASVLTEDVFDVSSFEEEDSTSEVSSAVLENISAAYPDTSALQEGVFTRQFLLEQYRRVLPTHNKSFGQWVTLSENSEVFRELEVLVRNAVSSALPSSVHVDDEGILRLEASSVRENDYQITVSFVSKLNFKVADFERGMQYQVPRNEVLGLPDAQVVLESGAGHYDVTIIKGVQSQVVTLGDMLSSQQVRDFVLNSSVSAPVVWGVSAHGQPVLSDYWDGSFPGLLVAGQPRSGKSWEVSSLVVQLCMFAPPSEVAFYVADLKGSTSDYYNMLLPHIRDFQGTASGILRMLSWILNEESKRRTQVFEKYGSFKNYEEFKRRVPSAVKSENMPRLYFLVDEVTSIRNSEGDVNGFSKEQADQFFSNLVAFTSRLANLGIHLIAIPHRITNTVIPKNVSELVSAKIVFKQTASEIQSTFGSSVKVHLPNAGDSVVSLPSVYGRSVTAGKPSYMKGVAVTDETNSGVFALTRFISHLWHKLDHSSFHGHHIDVTGYRCFGDDYEYLDCCGVSREQLSSRVNSRVGSNGNSSSVSSDVVHHVGDSSRDSISTERSGFNALEDIFREDE